MEKNVEGRERANNVGKRALLSLGYVRTWTAAQPACVRDNEVSIMVGGVALSFSSLSIGFGRFSDWILVLLSSLTVWFVKDLW